MAVVKATILGLLLVVMLADVEGCGWTRWYDRDNPSGTGDWELYTHLLPRPCGPGYPAILQARRRGTTLITLTVNSRGSVDVTGPPLRDRVRFSVAQGLWCQNHLQTDRFCDDYEVRWYCVLNP